MPRTVFYVSNRTAITAETLGRSLLAQFGDLRVHEITVPYVDDAAKVRRLVEGIRRTAQVEPERPIVLSTLPDPELRALLLECRDHALVLDVFDHFLPTLAAELHAQPLERSDVSHRKTESEAYDARIEAVNYTLSHDDGLLTDHYTEAEVILVGVSRSGKTPTSLYLAIQYGIRAANYPLTEEDFETSRLPPSLQPFRSKLFGLTIDPLRLHKIRAARRPSSRYASIEQCRREVRAAETLYRRYRIPYIDTTDRSIEEIASAVIKALGLGRVRIL
ncbi:MAG TPA: kinase/pyrophosphorylase [Chromatiales bacterium]|nr:kinase/pyrophosphorylase [Chromatiales bacterium]